ncbi:MAG: RidA family protein [Clostridia bacterium]|nr:RidA family protein [Clostridia bacterium]
MPGRGGTRVGAEERLRDLGIALPEVPAPAALYVPARRSGPFVFVSGQLPVWEGRILHRGRVGAEVTLEEAREAARLCGLNCLAAARSLLGALDILAGVAQVIGFVRSAAGFDRQPEVVNGASELFVQVFGERGQHARAAVGVSELPRGACVEIACVFEVAEP